MSTQATGAAGEYYIAAELSRRGWAASITPRGVQRSDVLAQHLETQRVIAVQVKTAGSGDSFRLNKKLEEPTAHDNEWVVLVALRAGPERAEFFLVPRNVIAGFIWVDHRHWLATPGKQGQAHNDNDQRNVRIPHVDGYRDQWDWLLQPTCEVPCLLPSEFWQRMPSYGLPPGHPGLAQP